MTRLRGLGTAASFSFRRLRARPLAFVTGASAIGGAVALVAWSGVAAALSQEESVRLRLAELRPDERSLQVVYHLRAGQRDETAPAVDRLFAGVGGVTERAHRVRLWHSVGPAIRLVVADRPREDAVVTDGRLPSGCGAQACEALALAGPYRVGDRLALAKGVSVVVVGRGTLRVAAFPADSDALPQTPELTTRALLVHELAPPLAALTRFTGSSVVITAPLLPASVRAFRLRDLAARLRSGTIRLERGREEPLVADAPLALLDELADRGDTARGRLVLVAGQGAALVLAFAVFVSAARRRETLLAAEQLETLGASRGQLVAVRLVAAAAPTVVGASAGLLAVWALARRDADARGLASGFLAYALPATILLAVVLLALAAVALLVSAIGPRRPGSRRLGPLELAGLTACGVVVWQVAATGALDPARIGEGGGLEPVIVLLPALVFFAAGVLLLRVLPGLLRLAERGARRAPFGVRLGFLGAARNAGDAAAATTFLAVALGGALFALNYRATLADQARDEARFAAGARWRVVERPSRGAAADVTPLGRFARVARETPTPVLRLDARVRERAESAEQRSVELLGLPAATIPRLLGWRDAFSELSRAEAARRLRPGTVRLAGPRAATDAGALRVWARSQRARPARLLVLHFLVRRDQRFAQVGMGVVTPRWRRLSVRLPESLRGAELVGVEFVATLIPPNGRDPGGFVELGAFEQRAAGAWSPLASLRGWTSPVPGEHSETTASSLIYAPFPRGAPARRGVHVDLTGTVLPLIRPAVPLREPIRALASGPLAAAAVDRLLTVDVLGERIAMRVVGSAELFPTVVAQPRTFVVVDYDALFAALNADRPGLAAPSEAWFFEPQPAGFRAALREHPFRVAEVVGVAPLTARLARDPLAAGARDVLGIAAIVAAVLSLLGLVVAVRATLAAESVVTAEYEALGVAPSTLVRSTYLRLAALSVLGVAAGVAGGIVAIRLIGAFVAVTGASGRPLPPIEAVVDWPLDAAVAGGLAVAALAVASALARRGVAASAGRRLRA